MDPKKVKKPNQDKPQPDLDDMTDEELENLPDPFEDDHLFPEDDDPGNLNDYSTEDDEPDLD